MGDFDPATGGGFSSGHRGQVFARPKLSTTLGNDTIVPLILVALDAFYDSFNDMPVFYTDSALTKPVIGQKEPTAVQFEIKILKEDPNEIRKYVINPLNDDGTPNENWEEHPYKLITKNEALIIKLLTGIGGEQSKHLSGLLVKTLGDMQVGAIVVAGHISIGDNETLAKIIEATVQQISRRGVERAFYGAFRLDEGDNLKFHQLINIIGKIYASIEESKKEQEKIKKGDSAGNS